MTETSFIHALKDPDKVQVTSTDTTFKPQRTHYSLEFWHPIFPSGWRVGCDKWWLHWVTPRTYIRFFRTKWQRMRYGFSNEDVWDMNDYMAHVMYSALLRFKKINHGYPNCMTPEEWDIALDKMIDGWAAKIQLLDDNSYAEHCWEKFPKPEGVVETETEEYHRTQIGKFNPELYAAWRDPLEARWLEGSKLFAENYDSLWD